MKIAFNKYVLGGALIGAGIVLLDSMFLEKYFFEINRFNIGNSGGKKKVRLVLITDLHFQNTLWPFYARLARKINEINPDLVMIAGDTLDTSGQTKPVDKFLDLIKHNIPKVAILGNHDHLAAVPVEELKAVYERHNCTLLINESKAYNLNGNRVMITGLDDFIAGRSNIHKAVNDVGREEHHLLLIHSPWQQEWELPAIKEINASRNEAEQLNISYIFAGHNHGGQVRFLNFVPVLPMRSGHYVNGWYNSEPPYLYLSKGFGTSGIPFRFMARSEMTVFDYYA